MLRRLANSDPLWPVVICTTAAVALWVSSLVSFTQHFDAVTKSREEELMRNGIQARIAEIAHSAVPNVVWDDAVEHLDNHFDRAWTHDNIGEFFKQTDGMEVSVVLDRDNRTIYAMLDGDDINAAAAAPFCAASVMEIVPRVRDAERARERRGANLSAPIQSSSVERIGDRTFILTATLVQPDFGAAHLRHTRAPIVVTGEEVNGEFVDVLARRYMLDGAHLHQGDSSTEALEAHAGLRDLDNSIAATIDWLPRQPGQAMLRQILPGSILAFVLLAACALFFYTRHRDSRRALKASEARANHAAYHDTLTGLPNRSLLLERIAYATADIHNGGAPCAIICLDLERFKPINDQYGHHVGDEIVQMARERLSTACRTDDTMARIGSDDFAILCADTCPNAALERAQIALEALSAPFNSSVGVLHIGARAGVFALTDAALDAVETLRRAEVALYQARTSARGKAVLFSPDMDKALRARRGLESDLHDALQRGDLRMHYQPQVDKYSKLIGVEALVRWNHPTRGPISPATFVPMAEECGLIEPLGEFTLRRAFEDSRQWHHLKVAINVSAVQLRRAGFASHIAELTREYNVDPKQFELEITEGVLLGDDEATQATLTQLRDMGFSIALDDFGTGYSNLSYLQRYPIDKIKIDRSFVRTLGGNTEAQAVIAAIVKLARTLKMRVIAEGVETDEQRACLASAGCWETQGFLTGRPQTAEQLSQLLSELSAA